MQQRTVCVVEDDPIMGESLRDRLELEGFAVDWVSSVEDAWNAFNSNRYDVLICDDRLPDGDGGELFASLNRSVVVVPPTLFITGYGSIDRAVSLLKLGAVDYVTKPFDIEELLVKVRASCERTRESVHGPSPSSPLGVSRAMRDIDATLERIAPYASHVLITGESGVGKEETARRLHALAFGGEARPFVAVNCGAFAESLLESELFGHERGAFTGAVRAKRGVFEQADGGTLFLDEVSEMPLGMQVKLLRVLQDRRVTRVGGDGAVETEFRLVCATHRDLRAMVFEGTFREDLFYRINVVHVHVPPLRERQEDIVWLADRFLTALNAAHPERRREWGLAARESLVRCDWTGNVRELQHCVERAWILGIGPTIELADLGRGLQSACGGGDEQVSELRAFLERCERSHIVEMLEREGWAIGKTAVELGISRKNLWERMRRLRIEAPGGPRD